MKPPLRFSGLTPKSARASAAARGASKKAGTKPELALRSAIWRRGHRFRANRTDLPGCPDIVFSGPRVAVFIDGDFWHGNNWIARKEKLIHGHNSRYWIAKIEANMTRDATRSRQLRAKGWRVIRVWESDIMHDLASVLRHVERIVLSKRRNRNATRGNDTNVSAIPRKLRIR